MRIKKAIIGTLCALGLVCACGSVTIPFMSGVADKDIPLPESVYIGEIVEVPEKKITKDGVEKVQQLQYVTTKLLCSQTHS